MIGRARFAADVPQRTRPELPEFSQVAFRDFSGDLRTELYAGEIVARFYLTYPFVGTTAAHM